MWKMKLIEQDTGETRAELDAPLLECLSAWKGWRGLAFARVELYDSAGALHDPQAVYDGMARLFAPVTPTIDDAEVW